MSEKKFENPKDLFLFNLNLDMEKIYNLLCDSDPKFEIQGVNNMCIFIQRLEIPSGEEFDYMRFLQQKWTPDIGYYTNMFHQNGKYNYTYAAKAEMYDVEIFKIWRELSKFMNSTYFKGWSGSKPQESKPTGRL